MAVVDMVILPHHTIMKTKKSINGEKEMGVYIKHDIQQDLEELCRLRLQHKGISIDNSKDCLYQYMLNHYREIEQKPRKVSLGKSLQIPQNRINGFNKLVDKIQRGLDLVPYQSRNLVQGGREDPMLNDFGIQHFHLGEVIDADGFIQRTRELAFVYVVEDEVFFIEIKAHGGGDHVDQLLWYRQKYIQIIHDEQPHLIAIYKISGRLKSGGRDDQSRKLLRDAQVNSFIQVSDDTCYMGPGLGITSANTSSAVQMNLQRLKNTLESYSVEISKTFIKEDVYAENKKNSQTLTIKLTEFGGTLKRICAQYYVFVDHVQVATVDFSWDSVGQCNMNIKSQ